MVMDEHAMKNLEKTCKSDETDLSYFISIPSMWRLSIANRGIILQSSIKN